MAFLVATTSLPAVYRPNGYARTAMPERLCPNGYARTTTAGTPHARANGETTVSHAELRGFIETGKDLQVKGIDDGELTGIGEELPKEEQNEMDVTVELSTEHTSEEASILSTNKNTDIQVLFLK